MSNGGSTCARARTLLCVENFRRTKWVKELYIVELIQTYTCRRVHTPIRTRNCFELWWLFPSMNHHPTNSCACEEMCLHLLREIKNSVWQFPLYERWYHTILFSFFSFLTDNLTLSHKRFCLFIAQLILKLKA